MTKKKILIVEDDADIRELLRQIITKEGWIAAEAARGREALEKIKKSSPDLIILDLMLPELDGKEICKILKGNAQTASIPIVMLTAKGEEIDRVVGFELGADDYVSKPFSTKELLLRIKAIFRRLEGKEEATAKIFRTLDFEIDFERRTVRHRGKIVDLTKIEFDLLYALLKRPGIVFTRDHLLQQVMGIDAYVESRTIDMHISRLREKLGGFGKHIETVRGIGYRISEKAAEE